MQTISAKVRRRIDWYRSRFQVNNPVVGRAIEMMGDRVRMDGLIYSVDTPQITRGHKSTLAFGLHEMEERELIRRWLPPDLPVIEFGGGLGVVSCLTNKKLSEPSQHIVVEANPAMIPVLRKNRDLNECMFTIVNKALAYDSESVSLNIDSEFVGSTAKDVAYGKSVIVQATTLQSLLDEHSYELAGIVCDIEGVEADLIQCELPKLGSRVRFLMAELHPAILGTAVVVELSATLIEIGFIHKQTLGDCVFFTR